MNLFPGKSFTGMMVQAGLNDITAETDAAFLCECQKFLPLLIGAAKGMYPCGRPLYCRFLLHANDND